MNKPMIKYQVFLLAIAFLGLVSGCFGASGHMKRGDELMAAEMYQEAEGEYQKAVQADPKNKKAKDRLLLARRQLAESATGDAMVSAEMGNFEVALTTLKKAHKYKPKDENIKNNLKIVTQKWLAEGQKEKQSKNFDAAYKIFSTIAQHFPEYQKAQQELDSLQTHWAQVLYDQASDYRKRKLFGNALLSFVKLGLRVGSYRDSAVRESEVRELLKKSARFGIAIKHQQKKKGKKSKSQEIVNSLKQIEVESCPTVKLPVKKNARMTVRIKKQGIVFAEEKKPSQGSQKYQSGIRKVDNPEFEKIKQEIVDNRERISELDEILKEDLRKIEELRKVFEDAGPSDDEEAIRNRLLAAEKQQKDHREEQKSRANKVVVQRETLSATPHKLDEPVFSEYKYKIFEVVRTAKAFIKFSTSIDDVDSSMGFLEEGWASTSDATNAAVKKFGVKADLLEFPRKDEDLVREARKKLIEKTSRVFSEQCQKWREQILARARQASDNAVIEATEDYMLYLFVSPHEPPTELSGFLGRHHGVNNISAIRGEEQSE